MLLALLLAATAALAGGCGGGDGDGSFEQRAAEVCRKQAKTRDELREPERAGQIEAYLEEGLKRTEPNLEALHELEPPAGQASDFAAIERLLGEQLALVRSALAKIDAGGDPVDALGGLGSRIEAVSAEVARRWRRLGVAACAKT